MQQIDQYRAPRAAFLPTVAADVPLRYGRNAASGTLDFIFVVGDAYVDHPSFGVALLGRLLEAEGYSVGVIAQPDWRSSADFARLGRPRLSFLVSAGNMDSMVANYTVAGKPRRDDSYSPGGVGPGRPDRATLVYCTRIREAFKNVDIIIGGIEASLRRLAHYDFWSDRMRRSMLLDSKADLLLYGMAERALLEVAARLRAGARAATITDVAGTVWRRHRGGADDLPVRTDWPERRRRASIVELPAWDELRDDADGKRAYAAGFAQQYRNTDPLNADVLVERYGPVEIVQNPPALPLETAELDRLYELPYTRTFHPDYLAVGGVPAVEEVRFSLVSNRGCFGGCTFCALTYHQGRRMQARSMAGLVREAQLLAQLPGFKGFIHDVGGPTANFYHPSCEHQLRVGVCKDKQCLFPEPCRQLRVDHRAYLELLRAVRAVPGVKKVFVRSGLRFDYLLLDSDETFFRELCAQHISGRLKVAPEHIAAGALAAMGKPGGAVFRRFERRYAQLNEQLGMRQQLVPYFISSHPGTSLADAVALAEHFHSTGAHPEQVQDFYPTPGTLATCMYFTELDPRTMKPIFVAKTFQEKAAQRALLQYRDPRNYERVRQALQHAGREDLIGSAANCLIPATRAQRAKTPVRPRRRGDKTPR